MVSIVYMDDFFDGILSTFYFQDSIAHILIPICILWTIVLWDFRKENLISVWVLINDFWLITIVYPVDYSYRTQKYESTISRLFLNRLLNIFIVQIYRVWAKGNINQQ